MAPAAELKRQPAAARSLRLPLICYSNTPMRARRFHTAFTCETIRPSRSLTRSALPAPLPLPRSQSLLPLLSRLWFRSPLCRLPAVSCSTCDPPSSCHAVHTLL